MSAASWVLVGRIGPEAVDRVCAGLREQAPEVGVVFGDPADGVHALALAARVRSEAPARPVVVPLVCRDRNRTALVAEARGAEALGCRGLWLLTGSPGPAEAAAVYELDPAVLAGVLRDAGVGLELWASGRLTTPAERARAATLAEAGVSRWIVPAGGEPPEPIPGLTLVRQGPGGDLVPLEASP